MRIVERPRAAVIGAGWVATHGHLPGYRDTGVEVAAIADLDPRAASAAAVEFGVERTFTDWREMLHEVRPDVVSVCVPNVHHAEITLGAIAAGAHVLCEKPLATSVDEAQRMFDAARAADVLLMADQNTRFQEANQAVRAAVESGALGEIYHAEAVFARRLGIPSWGSFTSKAASFGGALCDVGVHSLDLAVWLMGNPRAVTVSATTEARFGPRAEVAALRDNAWDPARFDVEDFAFAFVRFENGATLALRTSWAAHQAGYEEYVKLLGTDAGITNDPPTLFRYGEDGPIDEPLGGGSKVGGWQAAVANFVAAVAGRAAPLVREQETMNVQRIINAGYESADRGREVEIAAR